jgi:hypothetical protein
MRRTVDHFIVLLICGLLVFAVAKIVNNKLEIARLPGPVLETMEQNFPRAYQSRVETRTQAGQTVYDLYIRLDGEAYVVTVSPDGRLLVVSSQTAS